MREGVSVEATGAGVCGMAGVSGVVSSGSRQLNVLRFLQGNMGGWRNLDIVSSICMEHFN